MVETEKKLPMPDLSLKETDSEIYELI
jgi:glycine hydroxymethyltransferase